MQVVLRGHWQFSFCIQIALKCLRMSLVGVREIKTFFFFHPGSSEKQDRAKGKRPLSPSTKCTSAPKQRKLSTSKGLTGNSYRHVFNFLKQVFETMKVLSKVIW